MRLIATKLLVLVSRASITLPYAPYPLENYLIHLLNKNKEKFNFDNQEFVLFNNILAISIQVCIFRLKD